MTAHPIPSTIDAILDEQASKRSVTTTEDGTTIIFDPELGHAVSGRTLEDAEAEIRRRKAMRRAA